MGVKDPNGCERPVVLSEKVLHRCERPEVLSGKFCYPRENTRSCLSLRPRVEWQELGLTQNGLPISKLHWVLVSRQGLGI